MDEHEADFADCILREFSAPKIAAAILLDAAWDLHHATEELPKLRAENLLLQTAVKYSMPLHIAEDKTVTIYMATWAKNGHLTAHLEVPVKKG